MEQKPTTNIEELFALARLSVEDAADTLLDIRMLGKMLTLLGNAPTAKHKASYTELLKTAHTQLNRATAMVDGMLKEVERRSADDTV